MMSDAIEELRIYRNYSKAGTDTYITSIDGAVAVSTTGDGEYTVIHSLTASIVFSTKLIGKTGRRPFFVCGS